MTSDGSAAWSASARKPTVLLLGKLPPPYIGPAIATEVILRSELGARFDLKHVDTNVHSGIDSIGRIRLGAGRRHACVYWRFAVALAQHRPDLILVPISQSTPGFLKDSVFVVIARLFSRRVLLHLRGSSFRTWLQGRSALLRTLIGGVLRRAHGVIVLGERLRPLFTGIFPADRVFVVPNGLDFTLPAGRKAAGRTDVRLLYIGNLQSSKGIEDVIQAVAQLWAAGRRGFSLDVLGAWRDPATRKNCVAMVEVMNLPVVFHGSSAGEQKYKLLSEADIFVFTPREPEGHPWVIVEALAAGLPIIATDQGAIAESVLDGVNGYIVGERQPDGIASRIERLIDAPALRHAMGCESKSHYASEFTESRMVERLSHVFNAVISAKVSPAASARPLRVGTTGGNECSN